MFKINQGSAIFSPGMQGEVAAMLEMATDKITVLALRRGHANLLCIVPILVYVPPKRVQLRLNTILYICYDLCHLVFCMSQSLNI